MSLLKIDHSGNFAIRLRGRAVFEYCNHYIVKFDVSKCSCVAHPELRMEPINLDNVDLCDGMGFSTKRMRMYLSEQSYCMKGYLYSRIADNKPVGCVWVAFHGANEFQYRVRRVGAFGFDFAVKPEFRGQGIVGFMICNLLKELHEDGVDVLYVSVRKNNTSAIRAYTKMGGSLVASKRFFRVLGMRIPYPII